MFQIQVDPVRAKQVAEMMGQAADSIQAIPGCLGTTASEMADAMILVGVAIGQFESTLSPAERALFRAENGYRKPAVGWECGD